MRILKGNSDNRRTPVLLAVNSDDLVIGATRAARKLYGLPTREAFTPKPTADLLGEQEVRGIGLDNAERREINRAIARAKGNMSEAARLLGVSRATFYRRAKKLGFRARMRTRAKGPRRSWLGGVACRRSGSPRVDRCLVRSCPCQYQPFA